MKVDSIRQFVSLSLAALVLSSTMTASAADAASSTRVPVTMTVTANVAANKRMPGITRDDIVVRQGNNRLQVTDWVPAQGDRAGLELFILIDDSSAPVLSLQYDDLRGFINDQPSSTLIGIGYMRNGVTQIAQQLTADHNLAAQALRLPLAYPGAFGSPYLSVVDLMKSWPVDQNRREVLMITSGIGRERHHMGSHRGYFYDTDADTAAAVAQRTGTILFTIYARGALARGTWAALNGQMNLTRLSDATGGAAYYLGLNGPVTIQPYLAQLQTRLNNQYLLSFNARSGKKSGLQSVRLSTQVAGVDLASHDAVWIAGGK
jgi:hypothetical protein